MAMQNRLKRLLGMTLCFWCVGGISAQALRDSAGGADVLPVTKITIFSSGLAYYEHSGALNGSTALNLSFKTDAVNDALKSLVVNDPASTNPLVSYQSEQTLLQTLRSLKIDLSDNPNMAAILGRLRGAEVEITAPSPVSGKIVGVEYRSFSRTNPLLDETCDYWLSLFTDQGLQRFSLNEITSLHFKDPEINADLKRALDLIMMSRNSDVRDLTVNLPGSGSRRVFISYVIPAPVWKVSYRLNLDGSKAGAQGLFQGWAIVDNDSDSDWNKVELSLVAGRPTSFVQNLYPPYYVSRPVQPLAIAGAAAAVTHDTSYKMSPLADAEVPQAARAQSSLARERDVNRDVASEEFFPLSYGGSSSAALETMQGSSAGDQFEFTVRNPVSLDRRMSAMLPLVESSIDVRKLLFFSGSVVAGRNHHPRLGAELTNTSTMKLPSGPITVYDGGTYAGDALIEFWNEGEKRIISYGEDLSVTAAVMSSNSRTTTSVTISGGVMTINRSMEYLKTYTVKNNSAQEKLLMVEHTKNDGASLESPQANEQTAAAYRFLVTLPAEKETGLAVRETRPLVERITLTSNRPESLLSYTTNQEIPPAVQAALQQAVNLWTAVNTASAAVADAEKRRSFLIQEQERIRKNLEVTGSQTPQGQEYLGRLQSLDNNIDSATTEIDRLTANVKNAQKAYTDYLGNLSL
jgi:hypothetical protein